MNRLNYLDNIRILLTVLVIFHHTAIGYGALGGWFYVSPEKVGPIATLGLSSILAVNQAFFMSLFFFISAYFLPRSLDKKGSIAYIKDRVLRLGIPLLLYMFVLQAFIVFGIHKYTHQETGGFFHFWWILISKHLTTAHMWFVATLLIFEGLYLLYHKYSKVHLSTYFSQQLPTTSKLILFALCCAIVAFILRFFFPIGYNFMGLQFGYYSLYIGMYLAGILASRNNWLEQLSLTTGVKWYIVSQILILFPLGCLIYIAKHTELMAEISGGFHLLSLSLNIWEAYTCIGMCYFLLAYFRKHFNKANVFSKNLAANSYAVYFIHPFFVVGSTMLLEQINLLPEMKFFIAVIISIVSCFATANLIRLIPGMKKIL